MLSSLFWMSCIALALFCVFDVLLSDARSIRTWSRGTWLVVVVAVPLIGGLTWIRSGRPLHAGPTPGSVRSDVSIDAAHSPHGTHGRPEPLGPDDDPDFIRSLAKRVRGEDA